MIDITIEPGTYVVAVSGGVDSMVLLDVLRKQPGATLVVAHFDHGIRSDSSEDRVLVERTARAYRLPFEYAEGTLGPQTSEAAARTARYAFLRQMQTKHRAQAIITAHHQDDGIETALLNLLRGTNRRGLSALSSSQTLLRPLLAYPKADIVAYAKAHNLEWREDSTNHDQTYRRNLVRHQLVPRLSQKQRTELVNLIGHAGTRNNKIDALLLAELDLLTTSQGLNRRQFIKLDHALAREVLAAWLRHNDIRDYDRPMLERLVVTAKTGRPGTSADILGGARLSIGKDFLALVRSQR